MVSFRVATLTHFGDRGGKKKKKELECGPMPNVMAALPNIGGALFSTPQCFADAHYQTGVQ